MIDTAVASGTTRTIRLPKSIPVLLLYWTVDRDDHGTIVFRYEAYPQRQMRVADRFTTLTGRGGRVARLNHTP